MVRTPWPFVIHLLLDDNSVSNVLILLVLSHNHQKMLLFAIVLDRNQYCAIYILLSIQLLHIILIL